MKPPIITDTFEKLKKPPKEVVALKVPMREQEEITDGQKAKIAQMEAADKAKSKILIEKLEKEMDVLRKAREEQLRQRREQTQLKKEEPASFAEPTSKPKRGLFFWTRRIKSAQQQSQPELAGRRVGG